MSQFFKAFEQAQRDRALREAGERGAAGPADAPAPASGAHLDSLAASVPTRDLHAAFATPGPRVDHEADAQMVDGHLVSLLAPASYLAEPYRALRHQLEVRHHSGRLSLIAVTSAGVGEGKTTTSINLAGALAQAPHAKVLLVDADLRKSSIAQQLALGEEGQRGLVDLILDRALTLDDVLCARPSFNLDVLPAGTLPPAPYEVLKSQRLGELLDEARARYDYVVLDTAPLVPVPDSRLVNKWVDGLLLVVAAHKTPSTLLAEALNLLEPAKLIGIVFNEDDRPPAGYRYYYPPYGAPIEESKRAGWLGSLWQRSVASAGARKRRRRSRA